MAQTAPRRTAHTAYQVARRLDAACRRHAGLDWVTVPELNEPYLIDRSGGAPLIVLHGGVSRTLADAALLAAIDELDAADRGGGGQVYPIRAAY